MKTCYFCNTKMDDDVAKCPSCGAHLPVVQHPRPPMEAAPPPPPPSQQPVSVAAPPPEAPVSAPVAPVVPVPAAQPGLVPPQPLGQSYAPPQPPAYGQVAQTGQFPAQPGPLPGQTGQFPAQAGQFPAQTGQFPAVGAPAPAQPPYPYGTAPARQQKPKNTALIASLVGLGFSLLILLGVLVAIGLQ